MRDEETNEPLMLSFVYPSTLDYEEEGMSQATYPPAEGMSQTTYPLQAVNLKQEMKLPVIIDDPVQLKDVPQCYLAYAQRGLDWKQRMAEVAEAWQRKFGEYAALLPWLPAPFYDWDGKWLNRMVQPQAARLLFSGDKPAENMPFSDVIDWGVQGYFITAIYQGRGGTDVSAYFPEKFRKMKVDNRHKGKMLGMLILSCAQSPCLPTDEGWYKAISPKGAPSTYHRVMARWEFDEPIKPARRYQLASGFAVLSHAQDNVCNDAEDHCQPGSKGIRAMRGTDESFRNAAQYSGAQHGKGISWQVENED